MKKIEQFFNDRGSSASTKRHYLSSVKLYEELNDMTLDSLIEEADLEEEEHVRWKNRKIKERLMNFRNYLYARYVESSVKIYLNDIKAIYRHFEIELQPLPRYDSKQVKKSYQMSYKDLPTKSELIDSYYEANNVVKCIILFGISSGLSKSDMLKVTVADFINGCDGYIKTNRKVINALQDLKQVKNVIPVFRDERQKTKKNFITFCSPEATEHIVQYLIGRDAEIRIEYEILQNMYESETNPGKKQRLHDQLQRQPHRLERTHKLFDISDGHLSASFRKISNKLKFDKVGDTVKLRCHMLRKYQASVLMNADKGFSIEEIDAMQGRSMDKTHRAYFFNQEEQLKKKYMLCVDELMLFSSMEEISKSDYEKVKKENKLYRKELEAQSTKMVELEELIKETKAHQNRLEDLLGVER